jgi:hypothetical protein
MCNMRPALSLSRHCLAAQCQPSVYTCELNIVLRYPIVRSIIFWYLEDTLLFVEKVYSQYGDYGRRLASKVSHFPSLSRHYSGDMHSITDSI